MSEAEGLEIALPNGRVRLGSREMTVEHGARSQTFRYADAESLRLSFRPRSLAFHAFRLDLRMTDGRTLRLHNIEATPGAIFKPYQRWDDGFSRLARELVRRIARDAPRARRAAGFSSLRWRAAALAGVGAVGFVALRAMQALSVGESAGALVAMGGAAAMAAFMAPFLTRNQPRPLDPDAIPPQVLP